jgi:hypothetical protein
MTLTCPTYGTRKGRSLQVGPRMYPVQERFRLVEGIETNLKASDTPLFTYRSTQLRQFLS